MDLKAVDVNGVFTLFEKSNEGNPIIESWILDEVIRKLNTLENYKLSWFINRSVSLKTCTQLNIVNSNVLRVELENENTVVCLHNSTVGVIRGGNGMRVLLSRSMVTDLKCPLMPMVSIDNSSILGETGLITNLVLLSHTRQDSLNETNKSFSDRTLYSDLIVHLYPEKPYNFKNLSGDISVALTGAGTYWLKTSDKIDHITVFEYFTNKGNGSAVLNIESDSEINITNDNEKVKINLNI